MSYIRRSGVVWCDQGGGEPVAAGDPRRSGRDVVYLVGRHRRDYRRRCCKLQQIERIVGAPAGRPRFA